jgi:hypothetical protein
MTFDAVVTDPYNDRDFENRFTVLVKEEAEPSGGGGSRRDPPSKKDGKGRDQQAGILLPNIIEVFEDRWADHEFDKFSAIKIKDSGSNDEQANEDAPTQYDFFINMDNVYLKSEMKPTKSNVSLQKARFTYGMVLVALGLLQEHMESSKQRNRDGDGEENEVNIEERVGITTRALAPIILPMIDSLGALDPTEVEAVTASGDAV